MAPSLGEGAPVEIADQCVDATLSLEKVRCSPTTWLPFLEGEEGPRRREARRMHRRSKLAPQGHRLGSEQGLSPAQIFPRREGVQLSAVSPWSVPLNGIATRWTDAAACCCWPDAPTPSCRCPAGEWKRSMLLLPYLPLASGSPLSSHGTNGSISASGLHSYIPMN